MIVASKTGNMENIFSITPVRVVALRKEPFQKRLVDCARDDRRHAKHHITSGQALELLRHECPRYAI